MKVKVDRFQFTVVTSILCELPAPLVKTLQHAGRAALRNIPLAILEEKLRRNTIYSLVLTVVTGPKIRALNAAYRNKDKPTDVLSFSQIEGIQMPTVDYHVGEVIVCGSVAKAQAKRHGFTFKEEIARLTVHGVLHLFGYDHEKSAREAKKMFALQEAILEKL